MPNGNRQAAGALLQELLKICPNCSHAFSDHAFALIATRPVSNGDSKEDLKEFFQLILDRNWATLATYHEWLPIVDDLESYLIRCVDDSLSIVVVKTHFELLNPPQLLLVETLRAAEGNGLLDSTSPIQWHQFLS